MALYSWYMVAVTRAISFFLLAHTFTLVGVILCSWCRVTVTRAVYFIILAHTFTLVAVILH